MPITLCGKKNLNQNILTIPPSILNSFLITNNFTFWMTKICEFRYQIPSELRKQMIQLHQAGKEDSPACFGPGLGFLHLHITHQANTVNLAKLSVDLLFFLSGCNYKNRQVIKHLAGHHQGLVVSKLYRYLIDSPLTKREYCIHE